MKQSRQADPLGESCDSLDEYVDGLLSPNAESEFASHLVDCSTCRTAVDQQRWLNEVLRSADAARAEAPPVVELRKLSNQMAAAANRRRRRSVATGVAVVAATLLIAVGLATHNRGEGEPSPQSSPPVADLQQATGGADQLIEDVNRQTADRESDPGSALTAHTRAAPRDSELPSVVMAPEGDQGRALPEADFHGDGDVIAVRVDNSSPEVTVFQVFPTTDAQRRGRLAAMLSDVSSLSNGDF